MLGTAMAKAQTPDFEVRKLADGREVLLADVGVYEDLGAPVYLGGLYLAPLVLDPMAAGSKRFEMRIAAESLSARKFSRLWLDAIALNSSREERSAQVDELQRFGELFQANLQRGDQVAFDYIAGAEGAGSRTVFLLNGVKLGEIAGERFFALLQNCWLGDTPISGQFKAGIMGELDEATAAEQRRKFGALNYTAERHAQVASKAMQAEEAARLAREEAERLAELERQRAEEEQRRQREAELAAAKAAEEAERARLEAERLARQREEEARLAAERALFEARQDELRKQYREALSSWIGRHVQYPERALREGKEGRVEVRIISDRSGAVVERTVIDSSRERVLDEGALTIVDSAAPLPDMPADLEGDTFSFTMPMTFTLEQ